ncbi:MAG: hypothetical protein QXO37_08880 [Candidatus Nitrosocaldaceae archaeon]
MKPLEVIWFENISAFNEPVLGLGPIRASMKQLLYTMLALALALSIMNIAKNLILAVPIAGFLLLLAYAKPYGQSMEVLLIDMVGFLFKKKSIGAVEAAEGKKVKEKEEKKDKKDKEKKGGGGEVVTIATPEEPTTPTTAVVVTEPIEPTTNNQPTIIMIPTNQRDSNNNNNNLLHYIVPSTKDFDLELTDNDSVIVTGESTIHIAEDISSALIVIEVKNKTITRIIVNKQ